MARVSPRLAITTAGVNGSPPASPARPPRATPAGASPAPIGTPTESARRAAPRCCCSNRALFDALEERSVRGVLVQVGVFALILVMSIGVTAAHLLVKRWLQRDRRA
jgi:hypothetical protein